MEELIFLGQYWSTLRDIITKCVFDSNIVRYMTVPCPIWIDVVRPANAVVRLKTMSIE